MSRLCFLLKPTCRSIHRVNHSFTKCNVLLFNHGYSFIARKQLCNLHLSNSFDLQNRPPVLQSTYNQANVNLLLTSRPLSLKVKSSPVINELYKEEKILQNIACEPSVIQIDEEKYRRLSKDFVDSLSKNQLKNVENVWKDIPPLSVPSTLDHYAKLAKLKLTGIFFSFLCCFLLIDIFSQV